MAPQAPRNPPFRAEHLGSLLRPEHLLKKRDEADKGEAPMSELKAIQDKAIKEIVKLQQDLGYYALSDGEYRRHSTEAPVSRNGRRPLTFAVIQCFGATSGPRSKE
jgi:methionine synthase II (cobalamin-independent)